jgi:two-component system response regulator YesN
MPYTVVIVEDEDLIRNEIEQFTPWEDLNLTCIGTASDGMAGAELIRSENPDIVITDIRLPGQNGLEMLQSCRVEHAIILSGYSDFSYMRSAIKLGVFDYLRKPFDDEDLAEALSSLVEKLSLEEAEMASIGNNRERSLLIELPTRSGNHIVDHAITLITQRYADCIGLQETAAELSISESHLSRLFKESTGVNFLNYLQAFRVNKAIALLRDPRMNISMVCARCGFPTPGYFTKVFRKFMGMTPTQFRDTHLTFLSEKRNS